MGATQREFAGEPVRLPGEPAEDPQENYNPQGFEDPEEEEEEPEDEAEDADAWEALQRNDFSGLRLPPPTGQPTGSYPSAPSGPLFSPSPLLQPSPITSPIEAPLISAEGMRTAVFNIRVQRVNELGRPQEVGELPQESGVKALIYKFRMPGRYLLTPMDMLGNPLRQKPEVVEVSPDHTYLQQLIAETRAAVPVAVPTPPAASPFDPAALFTFMQTRESALMAELARRDTLSQARTDEIARERFQLAQAQAALAAGSTNAATELYTKLMAADQDRQARLIDQQTRMYDEQSKRQEQVHASQLAMQAGMFTEFGKLQQSAVQMMIENTRASGEADARRREDEMRRREEWMREDRIREEARMERREREDKERRDREDRERKERDEERRETAKLERERDRQHMELVLNLTKQQVENKDPLGGLSGLAALIGAGAAAAKPILDMFDVDLGEVMKNAFAGGGSSKTWVGEIADVIKVAIKASAGMIEEDEEDDDEEGDEEEEEGDEEEGDEGEEAEEAEEVQAQPEQAPVAPDNRQIAEFFDFQAGRPVGGPTALAGMNAWAPGATVLQPEAPVPPPPPFMQPPAEVSAASAADAEDRRLKKEGRKACRAFVESLVAAKREDWQSLVVATVVQSGPALGAYFRAKTLRGALRECDNMTPELVEEIVATFEAVNLQSDIPRG